MAVIKSKDKIKDVNFFRGRILAWYDKHARTLPWRAPIGKASNPYHVWLSEIMLQQTTVATVKAYFEKFTSIWPRVEDLASTDREDVLKEWAGLGYYARARNLHKCAQVIVNEYDGAFPDDENLLLKLPGIGPYTAAAITSIAFDKASTVMDGNIERVMARYFAIEDPLPISKPILKECIHDLSKDRTDRPGDFAQSLMDLGAGICTPKNPKCSLCPLNDTCLGYARGIAESLPKKVKKQPKPERFGHVYWIENDSREVFLVRRPDKGLLGGMLALPSTEWGDENEIISLIDGQDTNQFITHVFTHFKLRLDIYKSNDLGELKGEWVKIDDVKGLPTVFNKAFKLMRG